MVTKRAASAWEDAPNEPLGRLLQYIETENPGADPLAQDIDALVAKANADAIWKAKGAELLTHLQDAKIQADYRAEMALKQGLEEGRLEGEQRLGLLITKLEKAGRTDDVLSAATDALRRDALYAEFGI